MLFIKKSTITIIIVFTFTSIVLSFLFKNYDAIQVLTKPSIELPVIMYHNISNNPDLLGKYAISPGELEEDIVYLLNQGYTTVVVEDLIAYIYNDIELPEKPIMLTFDDGYYNMYRYVLPILETYNCKAVISIVGEYVEASSKNTSGQPDPYLNWTQINELIDSGYVEIQNHTYSMHSFDRRQGCKIMKGESYKEYEKAILNDVGKLQQLIIENTGYTPKAFTYPFGFACKECNEILRNMGFLSTITCTVGLNSLYGNGEELYELKRVNRPTGINQAHFFAQFEDFDSTGKRLEE